MNGYEAIETIENSRDYGCLELDDLYDIAEKCLELIIDEIETWPEDSFSEEKEKIIKLKESLGESRF